MAGMANTGSAIRFNVSAAGSGKLLRSQHGWLLFVALTRPVEPCIGWSAPEALNNKALP